MGASYLRLNVVVCGVNGENTIIINRLFPDEVRIMAEIVEWPDEIDKNRAMEAKIRAERKIKEGGSGSQLRHAEMALKKSLVRLEATK